MQLTDESDKRCYPFENHLLCYYCHVHRLGINVQSSEMPANVDIYHPRSTLKPSIAEDASFA